MSGVNTKGSLRGSFRKSSRGRSNTGRGNHRGKKDTRKYTNGKEGKTEEIRRALTHRSNLRKNYFKLLKKEGLDVPAKDEEKEFDYHVPTSDDNVETAINSNETKDISQSQSNRDSDDEADGDNEIGSDPKSQNSIKALSTIDLIKHKVSNREPLTFQERILLKKDRRMKDKERRMQKTREKLENMKQQNSQRQSQTNRLKQSKTKKGQILMAPRIESLLEKIKQDKGL